MWRVEDMDKNDGYTSGQVLDGLESSKGVLAEEASKFLSWTPLRGPKLRLLVKLKVYLFYSISNG